MQLKDVFHNAVQRLKKTGIQEPELEAALLLGHILQVDRTTLLLSGNKTITKEQHGAFEKILAKRLSREPLAYIIGEKEFWSLPFKVTEDVLIPRPETEFLLEKVLSRLRTSPRETPPEISILDLGTGSGVIAVIMALELPGARIIAVDRSFKALEVARRNAATHEVTARIDFVNCDWFSCIRAGKGFDLVISNPPYVAAEVLAGSGGMTRDSLQPEVHVFEPRMALDGGRRGIIQIKRIVAKLADFLKPGGWCFMEIGADQKKEVLDIFRQSGFYDRMTVFDDYAGLPRVFQARKKQAGFETM